MAAAPAGNGGKFSGIPPGPTLAGSLSKAAGAELRYPGLDDDNTIEVLGRWDALDSWCVAQKLAAIREMIRRHPAEGFEPKTPGGLPALWRPDLAAEVALELGVAERTADKMVSLAWTLQARLPLAGRALAEGVLNISKIWIIADATSVLSDSDARAAEALIAGDWAGKTNSQLGKLIARAVINVDPEGARKRREAAERDDARVEYWRERSGAAALAGYGLPTDQALAANQNIQARAQAYKAHGVPGTMDQLRVLALLDAINGTDARAQYPTSDADDNGKNKTGNNENGGDENGGGGEDTGTGIAANAELTVPLAVLLGLADRAGEAHGLGAIDPDLARRMVASAATNPRSQFEVIVTDRDGRAIGYGLARRGRRRKPGTDQRRRPGSGTPGGPRDGDGYGDGTAVASFSPTRAGPPDGYGTWTLTIGQQVLTVALHPIPETTQECDHRYESSGHDPGDLLRHMVQVRDGECALPVCVRRPRGCDFEHAIPWPMGRTCGCNGAMRCRHHHRVKQSAGWSVEELPGGNHLWTTPSGRTYIKAPYAHAI